MAVAIVRDDLSYNICLKQTREPISDVVRDGIRFKIHGLQARWFSKVQGDEEGEWFEKV